MKIKEVDFKSIKITFEFQDKIVIIQAEPYKTFEEIKQKALNKFMDIPNNIHFYYLGLDLSKNNQDKIGTIFNNKEHATIMLRLPKLKIRHISLRNDLTLEDKYIKNKFNESLETKNQLSLINNPLNPSNNHKKIFNLRFIKNHDLTKKNNINTNFNKLSRNRNMSTSNSMPFLNIEKTYNDLILNNNRIKEKYGINIDINNLDNFSFCQNHKYKVTEYCRTCKKFICQECRLNGEHKNHLTIHLNINNLEESIKLYLILIQTNEKRKLEIINKNAFSEGDKIIDNEYLIERKNIVYQKIDKISKNYDFFIKKIKKKLEVDTEKYKAIVINTFNDIALKINKQICEILNKLEQEKIKKKKLSMDEFKYYFDEIAKKEETLKFIGKGTIKYLLIWEINRKFETTLDIIELVLDEIINKENPFNLEKKYCQELIKINAVKKNDINNNFNTRNNLRAKSHRRNGLIFNEE